VASSSNAIVLDPSCAQVALRWPIHVGAGAEVLAGDAGFAAGATARDAAAAVWTGASPRSQLNASTNTMPANIPTPPTISKVS
jgi:hypothetical protein